MFLEPRTCQVGFWGRGFSEEEWRGGGSEWVVQICFMLYARNGAAADAKVPALCCCLPYFDLSTSTGPQGVGSDRGYLAIFRKHKIQIISYSARHFEFIKVKKKEIISQKRNSGRFELLLLLLLVPFSGLLYREQQGMDCCCWRTLSCCSCSLGYCLCCSRFFCCGHYTLAALLFP